MNEVVPAICAGVVSTFICNPLDIMRLNSQLKKQQRNLNLFSGLGMGLLAIPSFWSIYFPLYTELTKSTPTPIASYTACCTASVVTAPLWFLRQKAQINESHCFKTTPILKYYTGVLPTLLINLNFMIQIPLYEYLKNKLGNNTFTVFFASSFSKVVSSSITYPVDTLRVMKRQSPEINYMNLLKSRTLGGFYRGLSIYLFRSVPYYSSVFCTYEYTKELLNKKKNIR